MFSLDFFERLYRFPPFLSPLLLIAALISFLATGAFFVCVCLIGALIVLHLLRRPPLGFLAQIPDPARVALCFGVILGLVGVYAYGLV